MGGSDFPPRFEGDEYLHIPNNFPPIHQGGGGRSGQAGSLGTEWAQLCRGRTVGKSAGVRLVSGGGLGTAGLNVLEISGPDELALPLSVLLSPPQVANTVAAVPVANIQSGQNNIQSLGRSFASPFAQITWGIGGISNTAEVDIQNGALLTIMASFVRVSVFVQDPPLATVTSCDYNLSAFIGPGRDKGLGCQRSMLATSIPAVGAETTIAPVPTFARRVRVTAVTAAPGGVYVANIRFYRDLNSLLPVGEYLFSANAPGMIEVPSGGYYFTLIPGVVVTDMSAIFDLAI